MTRESALTYKQVHFSYTFLNESLSLEKSLNSSSTFNPILKRYLNFKLFESFSRKTLAPWTNFQSCSAQARKCKTSTCYILLHKLLEGHLKASSLTHQIKLDLNTRNTKYSGIPPRNPTKNRNQRLLH